MYLAKLLTSDGGFTCLSYHRNTNIIYYVSCHQKYSRGIFWLVFETLEMIETSHFCYWGRVVFRFFDQCKNLFIRDGTIFLIVTRIFLLESIVLPFEPKFRVCEIRQASIIWPIMQFEKKVQSTRVLHWPLTKNDSSA